MLCGPKLMWQHYAFLGTQPFKRMGEKLGQEWDVNSMNTPSQDEQLKELEMFKSRSTILKWAPSDELLGGRGFRFQGDSSRSREENEDPRVEIAAVVSARPHSSNAQHFPEAGWVAYVFPVRRHFADLSAYVLAWSKEVSCPEWKAGQGSL